MQMKTDCAGAYESAVVRGRRRVRRPGIVGKVMARADLPAPGIAGARNLWAGVTAARM